MVWCASYCSPTIFKVETGRCTTGQFCPIKDNGGSLGPCEFSIRTTAVPTSNALNNHVCLRPLLPYSSTMSLYQLDISTALATADPFCILFSEVHLLHRLLIRRPFLYA
jgi:hypothetical protein